MEIVFISNGIAEFGRSEAIVMSTMKTHGFVKMPQNVHKCTKAVDTLVAAAQASAEPTDGASRTRVAAALASAGLPGGACLPSSSNRVAPPRPRLSRWVARARRHRVLPSPLPRPRPSPPLQPRNGCSGPRHAGAMFVLARSP